MQINYSYSAEYIDAMVAAEIQRRREWIAEWYGQPCEDFEESCIICQLWKLQAEFERAVEGK